MSFSFRMEYIYYIYVNMDFLPLIIAVVIAPVIIYYIYRYSENSKKDLSVKTKGYTPPFGLTDKKIESLFIYKLYKVSVYLFGGVLMLIFIFFTEDQFLQIFWICGGSINLILTIILWRSL